MLNKLFFAFASLLMTFQLEGSIIDSDKIDLIPSLADQDTLVLMNVTGTLYKPSSTLADNQWRIYFSERAHHIIQDPVQAEKLVDKIKNEIVLNLPKQPVEEITPQLIADMQQKLIPVLGVTQKEVSTSFASNFGEITCSHLRNISIHLEKTLSYLNVAEKKDTIGYSFLSGIIFTNKNPLDTTLIAFLQRIKTPSKIVMVDNSKDSLVQIENALQKTGIAFIGVRYGKADSLKQNFDKTIGTIEFLSYMNEGLIITDDEALQIKQNNPGIDYEQKLDDYITKFKN